MRLRCSQIELSYQSPRGAVGALHDLSFESREGEFLSLVGTSGCGKTTLLRLLAGSVDADSGTLERIPSEGDASQSVLLVSQEHNLFPWMSTLDNAAFGLEMQGVPKNEREARARALLDRLGFAGREHAWPHELSLGMKQRVAVARCFLSNPAVMLMDEPFAALDCQTRMLLQRELLELWEQDQKTVVFVTHDVDEAILLSDRILVLSEAPARVIAEYEVPLPRPRVSTLEATEETLDLKRRIYVSLKLAVETRRATYA
jgi:NitT/TauT family transport system ATP-binding protein